MKTERMSVIAAVAAAGACGLAWALLPALQSGDRKAESASAVHVERARRLLHQYDAELHYRSLLLDQLRDMNGESAQPEDIVESAGEEFQERHAALWAAFEPRDYQQNPPRPVKASYGNVAAQIRDGLKTQTAASKGNAELLKDALAEVELALSSASDGGATTFEAHRLKGVIQFHRGMAVRTQAALLRAESDDHRRALARLAAQTSVWVPAKTLVSDSGIDEQIGKVKAELETAQRELADDQKALAAVDAKINDAEVKLNNAKNRAESARTALEKLQTAGVDFSNPQGVDVFAAAAGSEDIAYRTAAREMHALEAGAMPKAQIDNSGDFLRGKYLENGSSHNFTIAEGLVQFRGERSVLAGRILGDQVRVDGFRADLVRLEGIRASYVASQEDAARRVATAASEATESHAELSRLSSEAFKVEEDALKLFDQAAGAFQQATTAVDPWISDARERTQNLSPETKDRSAFSVRENDDWLAGHIAAQTTDARLAKASILLDRYSAASQDSKLFAELTEGLSLKEADANAETVKADEARAKGVEEVSKAIEGLEKAYRKAEKHWTFTAQAAGAEYMLTLFGLSDHLPDAVEGYRAALKGRENEKFADRLAMRLKQLESR